MIDFNKWANQKGVNRLIGDLNGDGLVDFALVGGSGWSTLPVAISNGEVTPSSEKILYNLGLL